jgi:hypothetical protein
LKSIANDEAQPSGLLPPGAYMMQVSQGEDSMTGLLYCSRGGGGAGVEGIKLFMTNRKVAEKM